MENNISPYLYSIILLFPPLAFSFYVNSGLPKNDMQKVHMYIITCSLLAICVGAMACTWLNNIIWYVLRKIPGYSVILQWYPELYCWTIYIII